MVPTLAFHIPFMDQSLVLVVFGLLIFGKRLPEVGKSIGQGIVQFKRGLKGIEEEIEEASSKPASKPATPTALPAAEHKFDPITGQPLNPPVQVTQEAKFDPYTGKPLSV